MELQTERLSLRPMSDAELQALMEAVRPRDAELADAYNDMLRGSREHPQARLWYTAWGAYRKNTGELVGDLCFKGPSAQPEIGYGMIEAFWGRGYATESAGAMCRWALAQPGVTAVGPGQAGQHFDGGGLSGAVDPQQGEQLPLPDRQVQAVHGGDGPVALGQALYFDGVHFCASFSLNRANTPMYTSVSDALISSVSQSKKDVAAMEAMPWT